MMAPFQAWKWESSLKILRAILWNTMVKHRLSQLFHTHITAPRSSILIFIWFDIQSPDDSMWMICEQRENAFSLIRYQTPTERWRFLYSVHMLIWRDGDERSDTFRYSARASFTWIHLLSPQNYCTNNSNSSTVTPTYLALSQGWVCENSLVLTPHLCAVVMIDPPSLSARRGWVLVMAATLRQMGQSFSWMVLR